MKVTITVNGTTHESEVEPRTLLVQYVRDTQRNALPHVRSIVAERHSDALQVDAASRRNLELLATTRGERRGSLLAVLDETDSGLDIDALKVVSEGVNKLRSADRSFLVITHYQRLLNYIVPDTVHVMSKGRVVKSGGKELALELEANGYADYVSDAA